MVLQIVNIVSGLILASPKLKEWGLGSVAEQIDQRLAPYRNRIGTVVFLLGTLGLIDRLGIVGIPIPEFGASFPQALPAIISGLLLATRLVEKYPLLANISGPRGQASWIGLLGIAVGLGSLLFGCFLPGFCGMRYL